MILFPYVVQSPDALTGQAYGHFVLESLGLSAAPADPRENGLLLVTVARAWHPSLGEAMPPPEYMVTAGNTSEALFDPDFVAGGWQQHIRGRVPLAIQACWNWAHFQSFDLSTAQAGRQLLASASAKVQKAFDLGSPELLSCSLPLSTRGCSQVPPLPLIGRNDPVPKQAIDWLCVKN